MRTKASVCAALCRVPGVASARRRRRDRDDDTLLSARISAASCNALLGGIQDKRRPRPNADSTTTTRNWAPPTAIRYSRSAGLYRAARTLVYDNATVAPRDRATGDEPASRPIRVTMPGAEPAATAGADLGPLASTNRRARACPEALIERRRNNAPFSTHSSPL